MSIEDVLDALGLEAVEVREAEEMTQEKKDEMRAHASLVEDAYTDLWTVTESIISRGKDRPDGLTIAYTAMTLAVGHLMAECGRYEEPFPAVDILKAMHTAKMFNKRLQNTTAHYLAEARVQGYAMVIGGPPEKKEDDGKKAQEA